MVRIGVRLVYVAAILALLSSNVRAETTSSADPEKALISTTDIKLFWQAYDEWKMGANPASERLAAILDRDYLKKGSQGVEDFIPNRIISADALAKEILQDQKYYESVRANTERMQSFVPEIRKAFKKLKQIYPEVMFPPVYFVIARRNSGGTDSSNGLIIGSEMFADTGSRVHFSDVVSIVVHELIHYQQQAHGTDLTTAAMNEGAADFIAELITGNETNEGAKPYGDSHEEELWKELRKTQKRTIENRGYTMAQTKKSAGPPPDLGYYVGYKICQSFYQRSTDKAAALKRIIAMKDPKVIIEESGYAQRFH